MNWLQPDYILCSQRIGMPITRTISKDFISKKIQVEKIDESLKLFKKRWDGQKLQSFK